MREWTYSCPASLPRTLISREKEYMVSVETSTPSLIPSINMKLSILVAHSALLVLASSAPTGKRQDLPSLPSLPDLPLPDLPTLPIIGKKGRRQDLPVLPTLPDLPLPSIPSLPVLGGKKARRQTDFPTPSGLSDLTIPLGEPLGELDISEITKPLDQLLGSKDAPLPSSSKKERADVTELLGDLTIPLGEPLGKLDLSGIYKPLDTLVGDGKK